jgi:hypothetical protein
MLCKKKKNYKVVIIIEFMLHQNIVIKIFMVDTLLNIGYSLELERLIYIMFFPLWKEVVVLIR